MPHWDNQQHVDIQIGQYTFKINIGHWIFVSQCKDETLITITNCIILTHYVSMYCMKIFITVPYLHKYAKMGAWTIKMINGHSEWMLVIEHSTM